MIVDPWLKVVIYIYLAGLPVFLITPFILKDDRVAAFGIVWAFGGQAIVMIALGFWSLYSAYSDPPLAAGLSTSIIVVFVVTLIVYSLFVWGFLHEAWKYSRFILWGGEWPFRYRKRSY